MNIKDNKYDPSASHKVAKLLQTGTFQSAREMLKVLAPEEVGHLIESSPPPTRQILWALIDEQNRADIIHFLNDEIQAQFALEMNSNELVALSSVLETDDMVDILQQLPDRVTREVLQAMSSQCPAYLLTRARRCSQLWTVQDRWNHQQTQPSQIVEKNRRFFFGCAAHLALAFIECFLGALFACPLRPSLLFFCAVN